jgi:hypothetical protein
MRKGKNIITSIVIISFTRLSLLLPLAQDRFKRDEIFVRFLNSPLDDFGHNVIRSEELEGQK